MSCYFQVGDEVLWNPSNAVGEFFKGQADAFALSVNLPAGIGPLEDDEYRIDMPVFAACVDELALIYGNASHQVLRSLLKGFLVTAVVLVRRGGGNLRCISGDLLDLSSEQEPWMPRD
ncbi:DUF6086 family protein [Streptomyces sp. NPDC058451]|uniref:DUF6086 family protein n=1 Tax=Streptomyces sp. NPDC058451 TaxID=3346506 RepID=UPI00365445EB